MRKTTVNIETALADPKTIYGSGRTVVSVRRTKTGRPVVTFSDGAEARYTGREDVVIQVPENTAPLTGGPNYTGPFRGWSRY